MEKPGGTPGGTKKRRGIGIRTRTTYYNLELPIIKTTYNNFFLIIFFFNKIEYITYIFYSGDSLL
jgi:hypothetical protein